MFSLSKTYNKTRKEKRRNYFKDLMVKLKDTSQSNPKAFWDIINTLKSSDQENKEIISHEFHVKKYKWCLSYKKLTENQKFSQHLIPCIICIIYSLGISI